MYDQHSILLLYGRGVAGEPVTLTTEDDVSLTTEDDVVLTTEGFLGPESAPEVGGLYQSEQKIPLRPASLEPWEWVVRLVVWSMIVAYFVSCSGV